MQEFQQWVFFAACLKDHAMVRALSLSFSGVMTVSSRTAVLAEYIFQLADI